MDKICEAVILEQLEIFTIANKIIPTDQFGFRQNHCSFHQLTRVTEYILKGFNRIQSTGAVFLDVAKAFDQVWHKGLIFKLLKLPPATAHATNRKLSQQSFLPSKIPRLPIHVQNNTIGSSTRLSHCPKTIHLRPRYRQTLPLVCLHNLQMTLLSSFDRNHKN